MCLQCTRLARNEKITLNTRLEIMQNAREWTKRVSTAIIITIKQCAIIVDHAHTHTLTHRLILAVPTCDAHPIEWRSPFCFVASIAIAGNSLTHESIYAYLFRYARVCASVCSRVKNAIRRGFRFFFSFQFKLDRISDKYVHDSLEYLRSLQSLHAILQSHGSFPRIPPSMHLFWNRVHISGEMSGRARPECSIVCVFRSNDNRRRSSSTRCLYD